MKKLLFLLLLAATLGACRKDPEPFRLDPDAKVYVKPSADLIQAKADAHLTPLEVVKQATILRGYNTEAAGTSHITWTWVGKDTISDVPALLRWGTDIIHDKTGYGDYGLQHEFIDAFDLVIARVLLDEHDPTIYTYDTIAYIPNANMLAARNAIVEAFAREDTEAVYELFKEAFRFTPITGAEYKELKKLGLQ